MTAAAGGAELAQPHLAPQARTPAEAARIARVTAPATDFTRPEPFEDNPGGAATVPLRTNADAFSQPSANMSFERELDFRLGNGLFKKLWVSSPSSTLASDGLGPLYNARSCQRCHLKDGRGHPPDGPDDLATSMFLRLSVPPKTEADREALASKALLFVPDPTYGGQLQDFAVPGLTAEGKMEISYEEEPVELAGGEVVSLRKPTYALGEPAFEVGRVVRQA